MIGVMLKTKWKGTGIPRIIFIIVQDHETLLSGIRKRDHKETGHQVVGMREERQLIVLFAVIFIIGISGYLAGDYIPTHVTLWLKVIMLPSHLKVT